MQIKNTNTSFEPVTVTFDSYAEYEVFRKIIYEAYDNPNFEGKAEEVIGKLYDALDLDDFEG